MQFAVRRYDAENDRGWAEPRLARKFGGPLQARRHEMVDVLAGEGFVAEVDDEPVGLLFWRPDGDETEVTLLWAFEQHRGIGTALLYELTRTVDGPIWLVTTNDNAPALAFYQRLGFGIRDIRRGAVDEARATLKPDIPECGVGGVPMRDEIELVLPR
jgi:ribosomal protein S18 acetylase RimI-like enzyme